MNQKIINARPTKINKVNLATFKSPVLEDLHDIDLQLQNLAENQMTQINFKALTMVKKAENIRASFKMSKAYGECKVAQRYVKLLEVISSGDFGNYTEYKKAVDVGLMVTKQLISHIEKLVDNQSYYSANLWKSWSKMGLFLKEKNININELFVPCGNFNDIKIKKAKLENIEKIVNDMSSDFKSHIADYESTTIKDVARQSLQKLQDAFSLLQNIRNSTTYHEYWTILKARIALALNDPNLELDNKNNLSEILNDAKINLLNFGSGSTTLDYSYLEKPCTSLLSDRAVNLSSTVPEIYEFYQRFYIENFIKETKNILTSCSNESASQFDMNNENFAEIKRDISTIAAKFKDLEKNEDSKEDLLKLIKSFVDTKKVERFGEKIKGNEVPIILGGYISIYKSIFSIMKIKTPFSHALSLEFAAFHLIVEYYVDRKGDVPDDYIKILTNATERLTCALNKDNAKLSTLPANVWSGEVQKKLNEELYAEIMQDLKVNLAAIKIAYKNFTNKSVEDDLFSAEFGNVSNSDNRNSPKVISAFEQLVKLGADFKYTDALFKVMGFPYAGRLVGAISIMIGNIEKNGYKLPNKESNEIFSTALGACEIFLEDVISGSDHPEKILEVAFRKIYKNKDLEIKKDSETFEFIPLEEKLKQLDAEEKPEIIYQNGKMIAVEDAQHSEGYNDKIATIRNNESISEPSESSETLSEAEVQDKEDLDNDENSSQDVLNKTLDNSECLEIDYTTTEEEDEDQKQKREEAEYKKAQLSPHEISYDPNDEEFFVADYIEEILSDELKETFDENIERLNQDPTDKKAFKEIRRIFHTWKGSGKQVGLYSLGYVGEMLNHLYDRRMDMNVPWNSSLDNTARVTFEKFNYWANEMLQHQKVFFDPKDVFDALKEEEEYYQQHYGNADPLVNDIELTSDLSFPDFSSDSSQETTSEQKAVAEPEVEQEAIPEQKAVAEPEVEPEAIPEQKAVAEPEVEQEAIPEQKAVAEPEVEQEAIPEQEAAAEPEVEQEAIPEQEAVAEPEVKQEAIPEQEAAAEPKVEPEAIPEPEAVVEPEVEPEVIPEPEAVTVQKIKLSDIIKDDDNSSEDFKMEDKSKISHETLTISGLKELSSEFADDEFEEENVDSEDQIAVKIFNEISNKKEKIKSSIQEEISSLKLADDKEVVISSEFYNTLDLIKELFSENDDLKETEELFYNIFLDIKDEIIPPRHARNIIKALSKVLECVDEMSDENIREFADTATYLEETLFEAETESSEQQEKETAEEKIDMSIHIGESNKAENIDEESGKLIEQKLDLIIEELLSIKERISVVKKDIDNLFD